MNRLTFRIIVALITFILGIAATAVWFVNRPAKTKIMPVGKWEAIYFETINKRADAANLPRLRTVNLPNGDLEVRVWIGFGINGEDGIILRRSSNQWSAVYLHGMFDRYLPAKYQEQRNLDVPKSGWDKMWQRLTGAGILTLPDATEIGCRPYVVDGIGYVVETNTNKTYRTYMYENPQFAKCSEAKQMIEISEILYDEFGLYQQSE
jgi:hypothetical protein